MSNNLYQGVTGFLVRLAILLYVIAVLGFTMRAYIPWPEEVCYEYSSDTGQKRC